MDLAALMAVQRPPSELTEEEQAEMDMLEAFYRQLCRFAYAIKALDPICMALIYEVSRMHDDAKLDLLCQCHQIMLSTCAASVREAGIH
ncbi:MAG: hypothetical protein EOP04_13595, partial [Proteobacteria bacterium]